LRAAPLVDSLERLGVRAAVERFDRLRDPGAARERFERLAERGEREPLGWLRVEALLPARRV